MLEMFVLSLPRELRNSLQDICDLLSNLTSPKWFQSTDQVTNADIGKTDWETGSTEGFVGWLPVDEWNGFLDDVIL